MARLIVALVICVGTISLAALGSALAGGSETVNYSYDAKGRLIKVEHSGSANNNVVANYSFDKSDNRVNVNITGAP